MILTNAVLSIAFAVVSNFAYKVGIPQGEVPKTTNDLSSYTIGDPHSPLDVYLTHKSGAMFGIRDGAVNMFEARESFVHVQDSAHLKQLLGKSIVSSNQVLELATTIANRLVKGKNPLAGITPTLRSAGTNAEGREIPFYTIVWPKSHRTPGFDCLAAIEIDARDGRLSCLELHDPGFSDYTLTERLLTNLPKADVMEEAKLAPARSKSYARLFPSPSTNEVFEAISSWLWLCQQVKIDPGIDTAPDKVDWEQTCVFTNRTLTSPTDSICRIQFHAGTWFASVRGIAFGYHAADCYFAREFEGLTKDERLAFGGKINFSWQELARKFERTLIDSVGIPNQYLSAYRPHVEPPPPGVGHLAENKRVLVLWTYPQEWKYQGFGAEFDLETGKIKDVGFTDPDIIRAIAHAQGKTL